MTEPDDAFLTEVFFDSRSLIAVRFASTQNVKSTAADLTVGPTASEWVKSRGSDAAPGPRRFRVVPAIIVVAVVGIAGSTAAYFINRQSNESALAAREAAERDASARIIPTMPSTSPTDASGTDAWRSNLKTLSSDLEPLREELRPWMVRTLLDVPRDLMSTSATPPAWVMPSVSPADRQAFDRGTAMGETLRSLGAERDLALFIDLPGPQSVAAAAGLASTCDVVFTMDNLPHRAGVVKAHETLGSVLYWRSKFLEGKKAGAVPRPTAWVMQGDRLANYQNQPELFDNRSVARLPTAAALRVLGVKKVLYVRPESSKPSEQDDLVDLFVSLEKDGIEVRHLGMDSVGSPPPETYLPPEPVVGSSQPTSQPTTRSRSSGSSGMSWMHHYWMYRYGWYGGRGFGATDTLYRTQQRTTPIVSGLDGGASKRSSVISGLAPRPATTTPKSGGSWSRTSGSSGG